MLVGISQFCFIASYAVALCGELWQMFRPSRIARWVTRGFGVAGLFAQTVFLITHQPTPASASGSILLLTWVLAIFYLYGALHYRRFAWGVFVLPVILVLLGISQFWQPTPLTASWFVGERLWGNIHGSLMLLAAVGVSVAFVASVMYLVQAARLRAKLPPLGGMRVLNLERLEMMNRRAINWAFPLWSAGLFLGAYLITLNASTAGEWIALKIVATAGLWIVFLVLMIMRYGVHLPGRRMATLSIIAFAIMIVTFMASHPGLQGVVP